MFYRYVSFRGTGNSNQKAFFIKIIYVVDCNMMLFDYLDKLLNYYYIHYYYI